MSYPPRPILSAEDQETDRFILEIAFEKAKLSCPLVSVRDGRECVDYLSGVGSFADRARHPLPSALLLDLKMPRMHGFEVLEWLAGRPGLSRIPAFVLSSSSAEADIRKARELGAKDYFVKPHSMQDLVDIVRRLEPFCHSEPAESRRLDDIPTSHTP